MCFVEFAAAFDSVDRKSLCRIMVADRMPAKLVRRIKTYNVSTKAKVRVSVGDLLSLRNAIAFDKATQGFRLARMFTFLASLTPMILCF